MQYEFKTSFDRSVKKLSKERKKAIGTAVSDLINFYDKKGPLPAGLGLKRLDKEYWEIRSSLKDRIVFGMDDKVVFYFAGDHDSLQKFIST